MFLPLIVIFLLIVGASGTDTAEVEVVKPTVIETTAPVVEEVIPEPEPVLTVQQPTVSPQQARIDSIAAKVGVLVPISVGECTQHPSALACFLTSSNVIHITQAGLASEDGFLTCIVNHENRHAYQKANGLITYAPNGFISNTQWLEEDAHNYAGCG